MAAIPGESGISGSAGVSTQDSALAGTDLPAANLLHEIFAETARRHPDKPALMYRGADPHFTAISYGELAAQVRQAAVGLAARGIDRGDRVAILAGNGPGWAIADLAALRLGAIVVPIYHTLPPGAVRHILADSGSRLIFVGTAAHLEIVVAIKKELPALEHLVALNPEGSDPAAGVLSLEDLLAAAPQAAESAPAETGPNPSGEDPATIVYTSGTTAEPKGVVLSHRNIASNVRAAISRFRISERDTLLSFLPTCHMFERTCGHFTMLSAGATIAYARDLTTIVEDVGSIRPTILLVVPRIVEKVYEAVAAKVAAGSALRQRLVDVAIRTLNEYTNRSYRGEPIPPLLRLKRTVLDRTIAAKFRRVSGGRLRLLVSGGAPLDRRLAKVLWVLGFKILEGYGLTEAAPLVCASAIDENRLGTVGRPFDGVEVKIGAYGEVLVRGPNVMLGYHGKPQETRDAIDADGWLHTGDEGRFDERGNLIITGRLKELIVTSYGKNISPAPIEAALATSRYVEEAVLYGDRRKFVTALIVPQRVALETYAQEQGITATSYAELLQESQVQALMQDEIARVTEPFADYERVKAFTLLAESFSVANGLLTPTLKVRRARIAQRYSREIATMYDLPGGK